MAQRPRVVVTGTARRWSPSWWCTWLILRCLGASPLRASIRHRREQKNIEAVIIGGGDDINPSQYNQPPERDGEYDPERDAMEISWIRWALENKKPLLGICRGMQLINVVLGGELDQNIRKLRELTYNRPGLLPTKQVFIEPQSQLAKICKKQKLRVNSLHSQTVKRTGVGMLAVGWDLDGFLQASEGSESEQAIIGVQWHPEYLFYIPSQVRIFRWLITQ